MISSRRAKIAITWAAGKFIQAVYDDGIHLQGHLRGLYCEGCESFKTEKEVAEVEGNVPITPSTPVDLGRRGAMLLFRAVIVSRTGCSSTTPAPGIHPAGKPSQ